VSAQPPGEDARRSIDTFTRAGRPRPHKLHLVSGFA
jgi:hypothetical protein